MRLTPLDIQQKQFDRAFRGLDPHEVRQFLELCADELEDLVRETIALKEEVRARDALLADTRDRERALQEALVSAQRLAQEMKAQAQKDAEVVVAKAEAQAEAIVQDAHRRRTEVLEELAELKRMKVTFEASVRALVEGHVKLLDAFQESDRLKAADAAVLLAKREA